ncbi:hypothetical protein ACWA1F_07095 [Flavobacterium sp. 3-218]
MKAKIIRLRDFLTRNKIFFEVITATALTFTGIIVSITANTIAKQANIIADTANAIANNANKISQVQTKIMESENTPKIEIQRKDIYPDPSINSYVTEWYIYNNNSKISKFEFEKERSYIVYEKTDNEVINIPIVKYFNDEGKLISQNEGLIYKFDNRHCFQQESVLRQQMSNYGNVSIKSYIEISYENISGKKEIKHFQVLPLIQPIDDEEWKSIETNWISHSDNAIHIEKVEQNIVFLKKYKQ